MSLELPDAYSQYWEAFKKNKTDRFEIESNSIGKILSEKNACVSIRSMLSIGHGEGDTEILLIEKYLKNLEHLYGVDPRKSAGQNMEHVLDKLTAVECRIKSHISIDHFQTYEGPGQPVDLILLNHVMYHCVDDFANLIDKALMWLAPGGHMILTHINPAVFTFVLKGDKVLGMNRWSKFVSKRDECKQHLKEVGWTVEDNTDMRVQNYEVPDDELKLILGLQFLQDISDSQLEQLKMIIRAGAINGTAGLMNRAIQITLIYKA